jgi:hypothetical protein
VTPSHEALRDAVLAAVLPRPRAELPALSELDLRPFWARFREVSPSHLRLGLFVSVIVVGSLAPRLFGYASPLTTLDAESREAVVTRAARLAALGPLFDVLKVVASLAYFSSPAVESAFRRPR